MRKRRVALLTAAACVAICANVRAQTAVPDGQRILSDPAFLPLEGQVYGSTAYQYATNRSDDFDATGALNSHVSNWSDTFSQLFDYGITDDLSVGATIDYVPFDKRKRSLVDDSTVSHSSSGWSDPTFDVTWRALDQRDGEPVNVDLLGSFSPDWIQAKTGTDLEDGSIARGGNAGLVGAAVSHVSGPFTIYGSLKADFLGDRTVDNGTSGVLHATTSGTNYILGLDSQTRLNDLLSFNLGVSRQFLSDSTVTNEKTSVAYVLNPGDATNVHLAANYHIVPNQVVASVTYSHDFLQDSKTAYPANLASDLSTENRSGNTYGVKLDYTLP
jgi:hypothetical protein